MTPIDWFSLLHPVLMILFVYPVVGATIRLGILVRERRLGINPLPPSVTVEHGDHGRWVTTGVVVSVLVALLAVFLEPPVEVLPAGGLLLLGLALAAVLALWRVEGALARGGAALLCWAALLAAGSLPQVERFSAIPAQGSFWSSHYWSGVLLCGLLLFASAAQPEIRRSLAMRRLHVAANVLVAVLLAVQAITGTRDLLAMSLTG